MILEFYIYSNKNRLNNLDITSVPYDLVQARLFLRF